MPRETAGKPMNEFKAYHPVVNFTYFLFVIGFSMFFMHPTALAISFICGLAYALVIKGGWAMKKFLLFLLPSMLVAAAVNPAFNHEGMTIIGYFPNGNPITSESIIYGIAAAVMLASVICHFFCYTEIMTSDKFMWLFGKIIPSLSLVISMTLRFVPRFTAHMKAVSEAQRAGGIQGADKNIIHRMKNAVSALSATLTWALENSAATADSMRSRGYGARKRTAYSNFRFDKRDAKALGVIILCGAYVFAGSFCGKVHFAYFPIIKGAETSAFGISVFAAYLVLCSLPTVIEIAEVVKWKYIKSKI